MEKVYAKYRIAKNVRSEGRIVYKQKKENTEQKIESLNEHTLLITMTNTDMYIHKKKILESQNKPVFQSILPQR